MKASPLLTLLLVGLMLTPALAQEEDEVSQHTLYDIPPRNLIDLPTAGTLPRGYFHLGLRLFSQGGALGHTDIGLSNRFMIGISFGGTNVVSNIDPDWNPKIGFSLKFRVIDELEYFPGVAIGYTDQGFGRYANDFERYIFKSRGFYGVASRSFYFYQWTAGWHFGINYSLEDDIDGDDDINLFGGFDATFHYNLALLLEYDAGLNDDRGEFPDIAGKGRGYLNLSVKWLFAEDLELEILLKDLLLNRREADSFTREVRLLYVDHF